MKNSIICEKDNVSKSYFHQNYVLRWSQKIQFISIVGKMLARQKKKGTKSILNKYNISRRQKKKAEMYGL